jgi:hypothetical protein
LTMGNGGIWKAWDTGSGIVGRGDYWRVMQKFSRSFPRSFSESGNNKGVNMDRDDIFERAVELREDRIADCDNPLHNIQVQQDGRCHHCEGTGEKRSLYVD